MLASGECSVSARGGCACMLPLQVCLVVVAINIGQSALCTIIDISSLQTREYSPIYRSLAAVTYFQAPAQLPANRRMLKLEPMMKLQMDYPPADEVAHRLGIFGGYTRQIGTDKTDSASRFTYHLFAR